MARGYRDRGATRRRTRTGPEGSGPRRIRLGADQVQVNGYSSEWLDRAFPWVYRDELVGGQDERKAGEVVQIVGPDGRPRGAGIWADDGRVAVRRFRTEPGPVDAALVRQRLDDAWSRRVLPADTTAWRWVHGENDDMPGVRIDVWGSEVSVALESPSLFRLVPALVETIQARLSPRAIWRVSRPDPTQDTPQGGSELLAGRAVDGPVEVLERGLRYAVQPRQGHDVGLYCDMRDVRAWLEPHLPGRRVLNLFAHTGAFSVHAAAHGAREVVTVDLSERYLAVARDNLERNGVDAGPHSFLAEDSFAALDQFRRRDEQFDLVIADPPSFSHGPRGDWSVNRDLARLVASACRVLRPGGWLLVASNHGGLSPKDFGRMVLQGGQRAERQLRLLHEGSTPLDFPALLSFPESRYLKCWLLVG